jgi:DNA-binding NarL/FixJ family response regulator
MTGRRLIDVRMPDMDGIETARRLKVICPQTLVVVISSEDPSYLPAGVRASAAPTFLRKQDLRPSTLREFWQAHARRFTTESPD